MYEVEAIKGGWQVVKVGAKGGRSVVAVYWSGGAGALAAQQLVDLLNEHKSRGVMK